MQLDPIKPTLKAPGIKLLKLKYDKLLSNFASKFNLRRYIKAGVARYLLQMAPGAVLLMTPGAVNPGAGATAGPAQDVGVELLGLASAVQVGFNREGGQAEGGQVEGGQEEVEVEALERGKLEGCAEVWGLQPYVDATLLAALVTAGDDGTNPAS